MKRRGTRPISQAVASTIPITETESVTIPILARMADCNQLAASLTKLRIGKLSAGLPREAARAIAEAVVDPLEVAEDLAEQRFEHQDTPSGKQLVIVRCRVWTAAASIDGGNGRTRLRITLTTPDGPWPMPHSSQEPILMYQSPKLDALRSAVTASAKAIGNDDIRALLRQNPRGIWNPPTFVVGAFKIGKDPYGHIIHTAEGSSRLAAAQELIGIPFDGPICHLTDIRKFIDRERLRVTREIETAPGVSSRLLEKLLTCPARVVVAVLNPDGTLCTDSFADVVSHYIESVHIEPRSWDAAEQGNVIGERLVYALKNAGALTNKQAADILQREHAGTVSMPPDRIAATLIRAVTNPAYSDVVREVVLEEGGKNLTSQRRAAAVGPLLVKIFRHAQDYQKSAETALLREHLPSELNAASWTVTNRSTDELLNDAETALDENPGSWSDASRELVARGVAPMAVLGLVLSDQGQAVNGIAALRGHVSKVMDGLAKSKGGLRTIADAIKRATTKGGLQPVCRNPDGSVITEKTRGGTEEPVRYVPSDPLSSNFKVRTLALTGGVIPATPVPKTNSLTPEEQFRRHQIDLMQYVNEAFRQYENLLMVAAPNGDRLIDIKKLDRTLLGAAPQKLMDLSYAVKGNLEPERPLEALFAVADGETDDFLA